MAISRVVFALIPAILLSSSVARGEVRYSITDLGDLGQHYAEPYAVNDGGQVAGVSYTASGRRHAFFYDGSQMIDLSAAAGDFEGVAFGLNDQGQVVGYARVEQFSSAFAFVWSALGGFQSLGTLGGNESHANAINNAGQVVGEAFTADGADHAFLWNTAAGMQDLGALAGDSVGYAINDHGRAVGRTTVPTGFERAFVWQSSTGMFELGTLGGRHSAAYAVNNLGQVVGEAYTADQGGNHASHAFIWDDSLGMRDLGTLGGEQSVAYGINDQGQVVGDAYDAANVNHAFFYDGSRMFRLDDLIDPAPGWLLGHARCINDSGQIVVVGSRSAEPWGHALLLTPTPEPASALLALFPLTTALRRRRS